MKKIIVLFALSLLFTAVGCSKSDDDDVNKIPQPDPPKEVTIEQAASGNYEMSRFTADVEIEAAIMLNLTADGKNFVGSVSFDTLNKKVEFDVVMDLDVTFGIPGAEDKFEDDGELKAKMSFTILSQNRIRFYVQDGTDDEPIVFFNGFIIDDIELTVTERLTNSFKMRGQIDAEVNYGGVFPGVPSTPFPTEGPIYIELKR